MYDFDTVHSRTGRSSSKWDAAQKAGCPPDIVPLTVADMEFRSPPIVVEALTKTAEFGMWGYTYDGDNFKQAISGWMQRRHGWQAEPHWMVHTTGVVHGLYATVKALTQPGDRVLVQTPVYHPFYQAVTDTGRKLLKNPLYKEGERYQIDFEDLTQQLEKASLMIFCNPHNPAGRVWSAEDVERVAVLCQKAGVPLLSDEIHCDIIMPGYEHASVGRLSGAALDNAIIATSASKTFSLAGLACATMVVPNDRFREKLKAQLRSEGYFFSNTFGMVATRTAYNAGADWLDELIQYMHGNYVRVQQQLAAEAPRVKLYPLEGTYLAWMDFSALGLPADEVKLMLEAEASVFLNDGRMFGDEGEGFFRMNLACPRKVLEGAVHRMGTAMKKAGL